MLKETIISLPASIENVITDILRQQDTNEWVKRAQLLHKHYMEKEKRPGSKYINDFQDVLAYLALRFPATYVQIISALSSTYELNPSWKPKTILDIGSGPGTGVFVAQALFPSLKDATCIDQDINFILLGKKIQNELNFPIFSSWKKEDISLGIGHEESMYDIVLVSNVLNELGIMQRKNLLGQAFNHCKGIMIIVEPGTPFGSSIIQEAASDFSNETIIAPYIGNSVVLSKDYWLHFSKRFKRPEFERRIRQHMRESTLMASDWEETKYSYVAIGKISAENIYWGRCVGPVKLYNGYLEVPILTKNQLLQVKVMKRHKKQYAFAKKLKWGQLIDNKEECMVKMSS